MVSQPKQKPPDLSSLSTLLCSRLLRLWGRERERERAGRARVCARDRGGCSSSGPAGWRNDSGELGAFPVRVQATSPLFIGRFSQGWTTRLAFIIPSRPARWLFFSGNPRLCPRLLPFWVGLRHTILLHLSTTHIFRRGRSKIGFPTNPESPPLFFRASPPGSQ